MAVLKILPGKIEIKMMERRSGNERRRTQRHPLSVDIEWEMNGIRRKGTLGDLSTHGCFVLTSGILTNGEIVIIHLPLSDGADVSIKAEIVNNVFDIGFGARFAKLTAEQTDYINNFALLHSGT